MTTPLTEDERAELEHLRVQRNEHDEVAERDKESFNRGNSRVTVENGNGDRSDETANQSTPVEDEPLPDTHWLHLADGDVIKSKGVMTHYKGIPVIGAYAIPEEIYKDATPAHRF
jgi:hypothetical protein